MFRSRFPSRMKMALEGGIPRLAELHHVCISKSARLVGGTRGEFCPDECVLSCIKGFWMLDRLEIENVNRFTFRNCMSWDDQSRLRKYVAGTPTSPLERGLL